MWPVKFRYITSETVTNNDIGWLSHDIMNWLELDMRIVECRFNNIMVEGFQRKLWVRPLRGAVGVYAWDVQH